MTKILFRTEDRESALQGIERLAEFNYSPTLGEDAMPYFELAVQKPEVRPYLRDRTKTAEKPRVMYPKRYERLLEYHRAHKINLVSPGDEGVGLMRKGLVDCMRYKKLTVGQGERILTSDARPSRVVEVYRDCIDRAKRLYQ